MKKTYIAPDFNAVRLLTTPLFASLSIGGEDEPGETSSKQFEGGFLWEDNSTEE